MTQHAVAAGAGALTVSQRIDEVGEIDLEETVNVVVSSDGNAVESHITTQVDSVVSAEIAEIEVIDRALCVQRPLDFTGIGFLHSGKKNFVHIVVVNNLGGVEGGQDTIVLIKTTTNCSIKDVVGVGVKVNAVVGNVGGAVHDVEHIILVKNLVVTHKVSLNIVHNFSIFKRHIEVGGGNGLFLVTGGHGQCHSGESHDRHKNFLHKLFILIVTNFAF